MLLGLQAGFGVSIANDLPSIRDIGFDGVRIDCFNSHAETALLLTLEVMNKGLIPLPIVANPSQLALLPPGTNVELYNEPNLNGVSPADYEAAVHTIAPVAAALGIGLWAGSVSNFNREGLRYLADTHPESWPENVNVSMHWYPHGVLRPTTTPHPGFASREAEVAAFKSIIGDRRWGISEFGYHTGRQRLFGFIPYRWSDAQVAQYTAFEWDFWAAQGAEFAVAYQLNDGSTDGERFGYRRRDGTWKPVAATVAEFKG